MDFGMPFLLETPAIADAAALCSQLRLAFVELNMNFPACQLDQLDVQEIYALKRQYGIYFTLHLEEECDPLCFNSSVRRAWTEHIRRTLTLAQAIGAPVVNMHLSKGIYITLPSERVYLFKRYDAAYRDALLALRGMVEEELAGTGTRFAIENTTGFASYEQHGLDLLLESPVFGLTLDIGHSHAVGDVDIPFYEAHGDRFIHMHGHDAQGKRNHLALGDGEIDLCQRFAWAEEAGARVVLETKTVDALKQSVAVLDQYKK